MTIIPIAGTVPLPTLRLYGPITGSEDFVIELSKRAEGYHRSIVDRAGFLDGSFTLFGDIGELGGYFDNWLGYRFRETYSNTRTWRGFVYDLMLVHKGVARRRSIEDIFNYVFTTYINTDDPPQVVTSSAAKNDKSIDRYGRIEQLLLQDSKPQTAAEARRDSYLTLHARPWTRPKNVNLRKAFDQTYLEVFLAGDVATANFRYESVGGLDASQGNIAYTDEGGDPTFTDDGQDFNDWKTASGNSKYSIWVHNLDGSTCWGYLGDVVSATEVRVYQDQTRTITGWNMTDPTGKTPSSYNIYGPLSEWIKDIVTTDCEFLSLGSIEQNLTQTYQETPIPRRAWDIMSELAGVGDESGTPYRIYADIDGRVHYGAIPTDPVYYLRDGRLYGSAGGSLEVNPWQVRPGVVRDMSYPQRQTEYNPWLSDVRDFYVSEVEVGTDYGLVLKAEEYQEDEVVLAQMRYQALLERRRPQEGDKVEKKTRHRKFNKYDKLGIPKEVWQKMPLAERYRLWKKYREEKRSR